MAIHSTEFKVGKLVDYILHLLHRFGFGLFWGFFFVRTAEATIIVTRNSTQRFGSRSRAGVDLNYVKLLLESLFH